MSLFKGENVYPRAVHFQPRAVNFNTGEGISDGSMWYDDTAGTIYTYINGVLRAQNSIKAASVAPATATNPSATATLKSVVLPAGSMTAGKIIRVTAAGVYNSAGTPTLTFNVALGATGVLSFVSGATTDAAVNMPWRLVADISTKDVGASGSVVADGAVSITLGSSNAAATTTYLNVPPGNTAFNTLAASNVQVTVLSSTSNASTVVVQQLMEVEIGN